MEGKQEWWERRRKSRWRRRRRRRRRMRKAAQLRRPATHADEKDIEFQLAHTCIYIQPTW